MKPALTVLALLAALAAPAAARACDFIREGVFFCPDRSDWAGGEWEGGGADIAWLKGDATLLFLFSYPGQTGGPLGAELDSVLAWWAEDADRVETLSRDRISGPGFSGQRVLTRETGDGASEVVARSLVEIGGQRLLLVVYGIPGLDADTAARLSRAALASLSATCPTPGTCGES